MPTVAFTLSVPPDWRDDSDDDTRPLARAFYAHAEGCPKCAEALDSPEITGPENLCADGQKAWDAVVAEIQIAIRDGLQRKHKA